MTASAVRKIRGSAGHLGRRLARRWILEARPSTEQLCADFYREIWHHDGVMHLYVATAIDQACTSVLDVGCGTGLDYPLIHSRAPRARYMGVDLNEIALWIAQRSLPDCSFMVGDIMELDLPAAGFDVVFSNSVVEHKADYEDFMRRLFSLSRKEVVIGFYRGLSEAGNHEIQRVEYQPLWEPKYGYGTRDWRYSYLNTYSENLVREWASTNVPEWDIEITHLVNPMLPEHPRPAMLYARRSRPDGT